MNIKALAEKAGFFTHREVMPQIEEFARLVLEEAALVCFSAEDSDDEYVSTRHTIAKAIRALGSKQ